MGEQEPTDFESIISDMEAGIYALKELVYKNKQLQKDKAMLVEVATEAKNALRLRSAVTQCHATEHEIGVLRRLTKAINSIGEDK